MTSIRGRTALIASVFNWLLIYSMIDRNWPLSILLAFLLGLFWYGLSQEALEDATHERR